MGTPPDTKARTAMGSPNGFRVGYVEDRRYESACSLPHVTSRDPWLGCCRHVGSDGPRTHAERYLPQLRSLHSDSCVLPISAKLFCYFLPSWTDKKKNHLQLMYSPNFCTDIDQGDTSPRGDSNAMCFLGTESPLGFLTSFLTQLFRISLGPN